MSKPCSIGRNKRRRQRRVVDDRRQPVAVGDVGDLPVVRHVVLRVAGRFEVNGAGVLVHQLAEAFRLARVEEPHLDAELGEGLREQGPRPAVEAVGGDEVLPRVHDRQERRGDRRLAAGEGQSRRAAVERRQALLQHVVGGVHQAAVDVAELAQPEQIRRVLGVVEHVAGRRVDRHGAGRGRGVGHLTGVQRQRAKALSGGRFRGHSAHSFLKGASGNCCTSTAGVKREPGRGPGSQRSRLRCLPTPDRAGWTDTARRNSGRW